MDNTGLNQTKIKFIWQLSMFYKSASLAPYLQNHFIGLYLGIF
jgi:hypothetical protein